MKIDTGKHPTETYTFIFADPQGNTIDCYKSPDDRQTVCKLWELTEIAPFHDDSLAKATKKINAIFKRLEKNNGDETRHLSFVQHGNQLLLVWASYGRIGPADDFKTIRKTLKLKR